MKDQLNNLERTADAQDATAARIRVRALKAEQAASRESLRSTLLDVIGW